MKPCEVRGSFNVVNKMLWFEIGSNDMMLPFVVRRYPGYIITPVGNSSDHSRLLLYRFNVYVYLIADGRRDMQSLLARRLLGA